MGLDMYLYLEDKETKETHEFSYYRKFNALQGYFVREDNIENCGIVLLSLERVHEIYSLLNKVRHQPEMADEVLPVHHGPFFVTYDYDDFYYNQVHEAAKDFYHAQYMKFNKHNLFFSSDW